MSAERAALEALAAREAQWRLMADEVPAVLWVTDAAGAIEFVNRAYCTFFGVSAEQVRRAGWAPLVHPDDAPGYVGAYAAARAAGSAFVARARVRRADGAWRWIETSAAPRRAADGAYGGHVGMSPDVTELVESRAALAEADARKDEFLATLAHELRNPLAPLANALALLARTEPVGERGQALLAMAERQAAQLARLVDDLLDASRIAHGKVEVRCERLDAVVAVREAVEAVGHECARRGHTVVVDGLPAEALWIEADPARLAQMRANLLTNACKYTPDGGRIAVAATAHDGAVEIAVTDSGVGLAPEQLERVFELFVQGPRAEGAAGAAGLGIGLALVRRLVELHGGWAWAQSAGPGAGSTFVLRLPAGAAPGRA